MSTRLFIGLTLAALLTVSTVRAQNMVETAIAMDSLVSQIDPIEIDAPVSRIDSIINFGKTYLGKPYRFQIADGSRLDCSGFVRHVYQEFGVDLPRTSASQANFVEKTTIDQLQQGDLMFFQGRSRKSDRVGHVALVTKVDGERIEMMHSTNSRGIIIETFNDSSYFTPRLLFVAKLPKEEVSSVLSKPDIPID